MPNISLKLNRKYSLNKKKYNQYQKDGFFIIPNLFTRKSCQLLKKYAVKYYAEKPNFPITLNIHRKDKNFFNVISHSVVVKITSFFQQNMIDALNDQMIYKRMVY